MGTSQSQERLNILKKAFERLKVHNPSFSIRSLAKKMDLSPAFVSKIFNGKSELPLDRASDFIKHLKIDKLGKSRLLKTYVDSRVGEVIHSRARRTKSDPVSMYEELGDKDLQLLRKWYLIPILDSCGSKNFKAEPKEIATQFGIKPDEASAALKLLIDQGYLVEKAKGRWAKRNKKLRFPTERSQGPIREYHKEMMKKAIECLTTQTDQSQFDKRLINGMSIATNSKNIEKAIGLLNDTLYEVGELLSEGDCDQVYHLNIQLIPLTK